MTATRILVVDDDEIFRRVITESLRLAGYEVSQAADGLEGFHLAQSWRPEAIVLDVMMPNVNGYEVCRRIRRDPELHNTVVIMLTALTDEEAAYRAQQAGSDDYIPKPAATRELRTRLEQLLAKRRRTSSST